MTRIIAVIPARMGSSRFPGKPLAHILGRPMIEHVYWRAAMCEWLDGIYVATCDDDIRKAVEGFGGNAVMTSDRHERATDRVAEAVSSMDADIVIMIQGDEPMISPASIAYSVAPMLSDPSIECVNLFRRVTDIEEFTDFNTIKVVMNDQNDALYFSRSPIPAIDIKNRDAYGFKQVCVIPFRTAFLRRFTTLEPTPLEKRESIDMLRALEYGYRVRMVETDEDTHAVDTPMDLIRVEAMMRNDVLTFQYKSDKIKR